MLSLSNITKTYEMGDTIVEALRGVTINFRRSEFVSILGPSGCGKTTLLNIIGGLDRYTSGQLSINGKPTSQFKDRDWDAYRNHSIGFVFQSYNLIPHQSVLANVELALTISGVSKAQRRKKAAAALAMVGLEDQMYKRPNQMSGGQMQRVAIARALVNDPEILLADEPTGALDTQTSVQVMEILKEISKTKLVIMVTHNPELAETYSNRIIKVIDGVVVDDSNPYTDDEAELDLDIYFHEENISDKSTKKPSMSVFTAVSLSFNNLLTKKARTFLVSFAGSIGIIGIALILSLSTGINAYITRMQEDTLSSYPITIQSETIDMGSLATSLAGQQNENNIDGREEDTIYSNDVFSMLINTFLSEVQSNDLKEFKSFIESEESGLSEYISAISYTYNLDMLIYASDRTNGITQVHPSPLIDEMMAAMGGSMSSSITSTASSMYGMNAFEEMIDDEALLRSQYDCIAGKWPSNYDEVVLVVDEHNGISDLSLYTLGLKSQDEALENFDKILKGEEYEIIPTQYKIEDLLNTTFTLLLTPDTYVYDEESKSYVSVADFSNNKTNENLLSTQLDENGIELKVVGIIRPSEEAVATSISAGTIAYTSALTREYINRINEHELVIEQKDNPTVDVFTGIEFPDGEITIEDVNAYIATLPEEQQAQIKGYMQMMTEEQIIEMFSSQMPSTNATYEGNIKKLCSVDLDTPATINIYASTFSNKDQISAIIDAYNQDMIDSGEEEKVIKYTDYVKLLMSSITTIIDVISGVLIAFVAISLVVSSIMIGVITYISVLERTKEIGILRAIGASKKDVARVFNAETFIIGLISGLLGIGVTIVLIIPTNIIIHEASGINNIGASLPIVGAAILVLISVLMTLIAGLIPSKLAAKKDPVEALRTE